ncbi:MAG: NrtA/SsuA/CpmA family ABC transporter substrate-binding protein [SAR324 cluster bacterium]|nr:NrtA/SsuA/CpmA family ABC transporter substrate-binding protein [SAR324 cluster bacterium]
MFKKLAAASIGIVLCFLSVNAFAQKKSDIKIGWGPFPDVPQISQAVDKNLWKEEGLNAQIVPFFSGRASFEALLGGQLDFAIIAEFPAVIGAMQKQEFGILARMSQYQASRIISKNNIGFNSVKDLAGRKIGTTVGTNVHFLLDVELQMAGVKAEVVSVAPPDLLPALVRGDVDAAVMFPSFYAGAKKALGDQYNEVRTPSYSTQFLLVGSGEIIDKYPDTVRGVLSTLLKGEKLIVDDPAESQQAVSRVIGKAIPLAGIVAGWSEHEYKMGLDNELLDLMLKEGQWIRETGKIKNIEPTRQLFRPYFRGEFLKSLAGARVNL